MDRARRRRRRTLQALLGLLAVLAILLFRQWKAAGDRGGQQYAEPFRIADNLYFVGANDVSSFLITGPQGHILLDGGYPGTAPMIAASIAQLGFDLRDVKVLLNSEPHFDHAGGLAELQRASGAQLWASEASAGALEAGGDHPDLPFPLRVLMWTRVLTYPPPRVDHRFRDGDTIRVGPLALAAHVTAGHTRGCTSWSFRVQEGRRTLDVVSACSLVVLGVGRYAEQAGDFARTFRALRALPCDVWVTSHGRLWGRYRKFAARDTAASRVSPFIDPEGYRAYVDSGEARFRRGAVQ